MYKILISDKLGQAGLDRLAELEGVSYEMITGMSKEELLATIPEYDGLIIRSGTKVDADVLAAGTKLRVVGRAGMGVDNVDVNAATMRGVIVMNTPGANSVATAEQTMALMLAASRHTAVAHASLAAGKWERSKFVGVELRDKVLGVVGLGRIGRLVATRAQAFDMNVIAYDPYIPEEVGREMGVLLVDMDELLAQSDYITLHTALVEETHHMINADSIAQMKDGVIIVNAARGKLIHDADLAAALQRGKVRAAGLDVFTSEPPSADNPLIGLPNVVHTPHVAASSVEAQRQVAIQIVEQVVDALGGGDFRNAINMPFEAGLDFEAARPFMQLAERLGALHAQLADKPIQQIEVEVRGDEVCAMVRPIASGMLKGVLENSISAEVNYINAPILADENGMSISQTKGINSVTYPNLVTSKVSWEGGEQLLSGVLFGGSEPRIVQLDAHRLEAKPEGAVLVMRNADVPGVIGQIGTILSAYKVNIGEWRMGRDEPGGQALSFINVDGAPSQAVLDALEQITAVTQVKLVNL